MKIISLSPPAAAIALLAAAVFRRHRPPPATSLRRARREVVVVHGATPRPPTSRCFPKNLTGQQVHEIMEGFAGALGVHCDTCHAADPNGVRGQTAARASSLRTTQSPKKRWPGS